MADKLNLNIFSRKDIEKVYKCSERSAQIDSNVDFETFSIKLFERLLVDLSWASSHLEGNTYSHLETQMILNHKEAVKFITRNRNLQKINSLMFHVFHKI